MKRVPLLIVAACCAVVRVEPCSAGVIADAAAREPGLYATLTTSMGPVVVRLFEKESPVTVENFVALARGTKEWKDPESGEKTKRPLYPGTIFYRVIPGFMIQGGDPTGTGLGDPGFVIPDEFHQSLKFDVPGRLAMANTGPNTGNAHFFITEVASPHLDGLHTIFGQVVEGQDVVAKIALSPRDQDDRPNTPVKLVSITFKREGPEPASQHNSASVEQQQSSREKRESVEKK
jgi:peptidyl-prolyl cis-trans isomerase A (cyclophilin A)